MDYADFRSVGDMNFSIADPELTLYFDGDKVIGGTGSKGCIGSFPHPSDAELEAIRQRQAER